MTDQIEIILNGEVTAIGRNETVASLIERLGLAGKRIAVECNLEIVPRSEHANRVLSPGDRVELVHAIGGG